MVQPSSYQHISGHKIVRLKDAAIMLGFTPKHLRTLERKGDFPARVQLGPKSVGWRLMDLEAWIDARRVPVAPQKARCNSSIGGGMKND